MDDWRTFLYPLGFLAAIAFGARFIIQWLQSEKAQKSVVSPIFWKISLVGNVLLLCHCWIQLQYHICLIQGCNAVISWRNLDLIQNKHPPASFKTVCCLLAGSLVAVSLVFFAQNLWLTEPEAWFRIPVAPWTTTSVAPLPLYWLLIGITANVLFSSRFWIQWWYIEKVHVSELPTIFWWLSLVGALFSIAYFIRTNDSVNIVGPVVGLVPYIRNLMLLQKNKMAQEI